MSFPQLKKTPYENWLQSAQWFLRKKYLDMYVAFKMSDLRLKVKGQLDLWYLSITNVLLGTFQDLSLINASGVKFDLAVK